MVNGELKLNEKYIENKRLKVTNKYNYVCYVFKRYILG